VLKPYLFSLLCLVAMTQSCAPRKIKPLRVGDLLSVNITNELGIDVTKMPSIQIDDGLKPYLSEFLDDATRRGVDIPQDTIDMLRQIKYVDVLSAGDAPGVVAACSRYYAYDQTLEGKNKIRWMIIEVLQAGAAEFTGGNLIYLKELLYHELYHCLLNKGHLPTGVIGVMSAVLDKNDPRVITEWDQLVDEMFSAEYRNLTPDIAD